MKKYKLQCLLYLVLHASSVCAQSEDSLLMGTLSGQELLTEVDEDVAGLLLDELEGKSPSGNRFALSRLSLRSGTVWGSASRPANPAGSAVSMRLLARFVAPFGITFGAALEKDAYEPILWNRQHHWMGPDVSRIHMGIERKSFQVVLGRFRVQSGSGLLMGSDPSSFRSRKSPTSLSPGRLRLVSVRGASELALPRGVGLAFNLPVRLVIFRSRISADASLDIANDDTLLVDVSQGGIHATPGALERRSRVRIRSTGIASEWNHGSFRIGGAFVLSETSSPWPGTFDSLWSGWSVNGGFEVPNIRMNLEGAFLSSGTTMWDMRGRFRRPGVEIRLDAAMRNGRASSLFGHQGKFHYPTTSLNKAAIYWTVKSSRSILAGGTSVSREQLERTIKPNYRSDAFIYIQRDFPRWEVSATMVTTKSNRSASTTSLEGVLTSGALPLVTTRLESGAKWLAGKVWTLSLDFRTLLQEDSILPGDRLIHMGGQFTKPRLEVAAGVWMSTVDGPGARLYGYETSVTGAFGLVSFSRPSARIYAVVTAKATSNLSFQIKYTEISRQITRGSEAAVSKIPPAQRIILFQMIWKR